MTNKLLLEVLEPADALPPKNTFQSLPKSPQSIEELREICGDHPGDCKCVFCDHPLWESNVAYGFLDTHEATPSLEAESEGLRQTTIEYTLPQPESTPRKKPKNKTRFIALITALFIAASATSIAVWDTVHGSGNTNAPVRHRAGTPPNWPAVTAAVKDSVVAIWASESEGSGFIFDTEGHVVTNSHVVEGETDFLVYLADGRIFEARKVKADPLTDTAVIRILAPPADLQPVYVGDSSALSVGDPVLAIGNPRGLAGTTTQGIVSSLNRPSQTGKLLTPSFINAIQLDAPINHGNSGGPLFNASGQVVGITYAGYGDTGWQGLNFAIPINLANRVVEGIITDGSVSHAFLGVVVDEGSAVYQGQARLGAAILDVVATSPASSAGLRAGDVVVQLNDITIDGPEALTSWLQEQEPNSNVTLTIVRDGTVQTVETSLRTRMGYEYKISELPFVGTWQYAGLEVDVPPVPSEWIRDNLYWSWGNHRLYHRSSTDADYVAFIENYIISDDNPSQDLRISFKLIAGGTVENWTGRWNEDETATQWRLVDNGSTLRLNSASFYNEFQFVSPGVLIYSIGFGSTHSDPVARNWLNSIEVKIIFQNHDVQVRIIG